MQLPSLYFFLSFIFLFTKTAHGILVTHGNGTTEDVYSLYSTIGDFVDSPRGPFPITLLRKHDVVTCKINLPPSSISSHFLVFLDDPFEDQLYAKCTSFFFDSYAYGAFLTNMAQEGGAAGVLLMGFSSEKKYSHYRFAGVNSKIKIPLLVTTKETINLFTVNNFTSVELPTISSSDQHFILSLRKAFRAMNIVNCILWPILAALTAYFTCTDIIMYTRLAKSKRTIHPILTKATPCVGALMISIWHIVDPFSYKLKYQFPGSFLVVCYFGIFYVTSCLLLKTWILAVGDKLKSQRVFKFSIIFITVFTIMNAVMTIIWVAVGRVLLPMGVIFGGITAVVCGTGFIYYGKDIVLILSKGGTNTSYRNLSTKVIIFTVVFVVFVYTFVFLYVGEVLGTVLSEFMLQAALGIAFIIMYTALFLRKLSRTTENSDSAGNAAASGGSASASKNSSTTSYSSFSSSPTVTTSGREVTVVAV